MKAVCVFCGSKSGNKPAYEQMAITVGNLFVDRGIDLVYGGGSIGLMGVIADTLLARGGHVYGVIPQHLRQLEVQHDAATEMHIVANMHERKAMMGDLSDGFLTLPGGLGTLEELFEVLSWAQLGIHQKPIGLLNVDGYFDSLLAFVDTCVSEGFTREKYRRLLLVDDDPVRLLDAMAGYSAPSVELPLKPSDR